MNLLDMTATVPSKAVCLGSSAWLSLSHGFGRVSHNPSALQAELTDDLALAGHRAWECLSVSEVLFICEREPVDAIVIGADLEDLDVVEAQMRRLTLRLKPGATARDVIGELPQLFPPMRTAVQ